MGTSHVLLHLGCFAMLLGYHGVAKASSADSAYHVYLGTYTGGGSASKGIYRFMFEPASGGVSAPELAAEAPNPAFLAIHPTGRFLYAVSEVANFGGKASGAVSAFSLDRQVGTLSLLNHQPSGGAGPCHLDVDRSGRCLLVANYGGGTVAALPIASDGRLGAAGSVIAHSGSSVNRMRQEKPHAHFITGSPDGRFALACDLGADRIFVYTLDAAKAVLAAHEPPAVRLAPGAGPRHLAVHPTGRFVFVVNELNSTVTAFSWEVARGRLQEIQSLSTLPAGYTNASTTAEIEVHPNGRFLYASNRGHDSIAVMSIDPSNGRLGLVEIVPSGGKTPRSFGIGPNGRHLFAANQGSDSVVILALDPGNGRLRPTGTSVSVPAPVCVKFLAP